MNFSASNALFELMKHVFSQVVEPAFLTFKCASLVDRIQCYNLVIGDIDKTAKLVIDHVEQRRQQDG